MTKNLTDHDCSIHIWGFTLVVFCPTWLIYRVGIKVISIWYSPFPLYTQVLSFYSSFYFSLSLSLSLLQTFISCSLSLYIYFPEIFVRLILPDGFRAVHNINLACY